MPFCVSRVGGGEVVGRALGVGMLCLKFPQIVNARASFHDGVLRGGYGLGAVSGCCRADDGAVVVARHDRTFNTS